MFLCADDAEAKQIVSRLARELGYEPIDAGPLASARQVEALAGLMATLAYGVGMGTDQAIHLVLR